MCLFIFSFSLFLSVGKFICVCSLRLYEQDLDVFCVYVSVYMEFDMHSTVALRETLSFSFNAQFSFIFLFAYLLNLQHSQFTDVHQPMVCYDNACINMLCRLYFSVATHSAKKDVQLLCCCCCFCSYMLAAVAVVVVGTFDFFSSN